MKIGIVGATIWGNRGAEAMLCTTIGILKKQFPNSKFNVFSSYPQEDKNLCNTEDIEFYNYKPLSLALKTTPAALLKINTPETKAIKECSCIIDLAGISYSDGREKFLLYNIFSILPTLFLKVPTIKLSQALGTFHNPINRFFSKLFLPKYEYIFARGEYTLSNLNQLQLSNIRYKLSSDVAFNYDPSFSLSNEGSESIRSIVYKLQSSNKKSIAIIPSSLLDTKDDNYQNKIEFIIKELRTLDYQIALIPNATRARTNKPRNNDIYTIEKLSETFSRDQDVLSLTKDVNTKGIKEILNEVDMVLTSRFHGMVASLTLKKPTLVIGWSHKYEEVLKQFDIEKMHLDYTASFDRISEVLNHFISEIDLCQKKIQENLPGVKELSYKQFSFLETYLKDRIEEKK